jgi:hypothetical protein
MSKLLTEISRIHELMGLKNFINESFLYNKFLLNENTGYGDAMQIIKSLVKKTTQNLTDIEKGYLKNIIEEFNQKYGDEYGNLVDEGKMTDLIRTNLTKIINNLPENDVFRFFDNVITRVTRNDIATAGLNSVITLNDAFKKIMDQQINANNSTFLDSLKYVYNKGGIKNSDLPEELINELEGKILSLIDEIPTDNPMGKYLLDIKNQIDEFRGNEKQISGDVKTNMNDLKTALTIADTNVGVLTIKDISDKLKVLANSDQSIRQGEYLDITTDIANQTELKKLMGNDKENFIKNLNTFEDLENLWIIIQHSDNDIEFQKEILKILQNNQQTLETKFSTNSQDIKMGIAMLEDRVMVNTNTSVVGYRDSGMEDFGELINGKQTYGSQGGVNENGEWIPRPIELDGKIYFYESPQRLIDDVEFLNKLNEKRSLMGLGSMEDYLKKMNETDNFIDDLVDEVIQIEVKGNDKIVHDIFGKNGIYYSKGIGLIRDLGDKFLKDYKKLYVEGASKQEIEEYLKGLELLKSKFGDKKIYTTTMEGGTKKMTLDEFINDVKNNYKRIYDENGDWSPLNKLDTNYRDNPLELTTFIKTILTKDEYDDFVKKIQDYNKAVKDTPEKLKLKNELDKEFENIKLKLNQNEKYVKNWINRVDDITKNIKKNTAVGDFSEQKVNELFEKNGLKVEYTASNGSPIDTQLSIDQIIIDTKNIFGGGVKTVQTKTATKIEEGEFEIINGKRTGNWIPKKGTNTYWCEILMSQKVGKPSQIDLAGFYDPNNGITIITGKQKGLERTVREDGKRGKIKYNPLDGTPFRSNTMELPGSVIERKWDGSPMGTFIIDAETPKIVG